MKNSAANVSNVSAHRTVGERQISYSVVRVGVRPDVTAIVMRGVTAHRAVDEDQRSGRDAAAVITRVVAAHRAVGESQRMGPDAAATGEDGVDIAVLNRHARNFNHSAGRLNIEYAIRGISIDDRIRLSLTHDAHSI